MNSNFEENIYSQRYSLDNFPIVATLTIESHNKTSRQNFNARTQNYNRKRLSFDSNFDNIENICPKKSHPPNNHQRTKNFYQILAKNHQNHNNGLNNQQNLQYPHQIHQNFSNPHQVHHKTPNNKNNFQKNHPKTPKNHQKHKNQTKQNKNQNNQPKNHQNFNKKPQTTNNAIKKPKNAKNNRVLNYNLIKTSLKKCNEGNKIKNLTAKNPKTQIDFAKNLAFEKLLSKMQDFYALPNILSPIKDAKPHFDYSLYEVDTGFLFSPPKSHSRPSLKMKFKRVNNEVRVDTTQRLIDDNLRRMIDNYAANVENIVMEIEREKNFNKNC